METPAPIAKLVHLPQRPSFDLVLMFDAIEKQKHLAELIGHPAIELRAISMLVESGQSLMSEANDLH